MNEWMNEWMNATKSKQYIWQRNPAHYARLLCTVNIVYYIAWWLWKSVSLLMIFLVSKEGLNCTIRQKKRRVFSTVVNPVQFWLVQLMTVPFLFNGRISRDDCLGFGKLSEMYRNCTVHTLSTLIYMSSSYKWTKTC